MIKNIQALYELLKKVKLNIDYILIVTLMVTGIDIYLNNFSNFIVHIFSENEISKLSEVFSYITDSFTIVLFFLIYLYLLHLLSFYLIKLLNFKHSDSVFNINSLKLTLNNYNSFLFVSTKYLLLTVLISHLIDNRSIQVFNWVIINMKFSSFFSSVLKFYFLILMLFSIIDSVYTVFTAKILKR